MRRWVEWCQGSEQWRQHSDFRQAKVWFAAKKLLLNEAKTQYLVRNLSRGHKVNEENSVKLLGFVVDHKLSWGAHVKEVVKKLSRVVFFLRKLKIHVSSIL